MELSTASRHSLRSSMTLFKASSIIRFLSFFLSPCALSSLSISCRNTSSLIIFDINNPCCHKRQNWVGMLRIFKDQIKQYHYLLTHLLLYLFQLKYILFGYLDIHQCLNTVTLFRSDYSLIRRFLIFQVILYNHSSEHLLISLESSF